MVDVPSHPRSARTRCALVDPRRVVRGAPVVRRDLDTPDVLGRPDGQASVPRRHAESLREGRIPVQLCEVEELIVLHEPIGFVRAHHRHVCVAILAQDELGRTHGGAACSRDDPVVRAQRVLAADVRPVPEEDMAMIWIVSAQHGVPVPCCLGYLESGGQLRVAGDRAPEGRITEDRAELDRILVRDQPGLLQLVDLRRCRERADRSAAAWRPWRRPRTLPSPGRPRSLTRRRTPSCASRSRPC